MGESKQVEWSKEKNEKLKSERGISFEEIYLAIQNGKLLDIVPHPNPLYAHQKIYVLELNEYVVMVPFVENAQHIFLKTAYPSRQAAKKYQRQGEYHAPQK